MAYIEFSRGVEEVPTSVRLLKSKTGERGSAIFRFETLNTPTNDLYGMRMVDSEGELFCRELRAKYINGQFAALEVIYEMANQSEWDRFMRIIQEFSASKNMC
ncbi:MAG: photosystem II reaction center protein Psb28, partial [Thermostichales cyanobacterium SZTDM-1c_bins_54]